MIRKTSIVSIAVYAAWMGVAGQAQQAQVKVATGASHGVLLKADGSVWTWGSNTEGQLGTEGDYSSTPVRVESLSGIRDIAAGTTFP